MIVLEDVELAYDYLLEGKFKKVEQMLKMILLEEEEVKNK